MAERKEIFEESLDSVSGGRITYTWDGTTGTIGIDGDNPFTLVDKEGFVSYYKANGSSMDDATMLNKLMELGYIQ